MKTLRFKTNIKCAGCVAKVTPHINAVKGVAGKWQVDINNPNKILTIDATDMQAEEIKMAIQKAGFTVEQV